MIFISNWNKLRWLFSMHFNTSRKSLSGGFPNTSDYLLENHKQLSAASNIEISVKDRKESFKNPETHIYSFFEVSVKLIFNHISDSTQTLVLTRVKLYLRRALDKNIRYKVIEMDPKGNLYLHKTAFLCKNDIIKRLVSGKYHLVESSPIGKSLNVSHIGNKQMALYVLWWVVCLMLPDLYWISF